MKKVETLRELQLIQVYIYKEILDICEKNNLKLYLNGGTLLGAIRHHGFIPWDDDIDLNMSRPDYEKLKKITDCKIGDNCHLLDPELNDNFNGCIPNVVYTNSESISKQFYNEKSKIGISIFVYDGVPVCKLNRFFYFMVMYILKAEHALCRTNFKYANTKIAKVVGPILRPFFRNKNISKYKNKIIKWQKKYPYEYSKLVAPNVDCNPWKEVASKTIFDESDKITYEGIESNVFVNYDEQLKNVYGDYMTFPPKEKQIPKHSFEAKIEESFDYNFMEL